MNRIEGLAESIKKRIKDLNINLDISKELFSLQNSVDFSISDVEFEVIELYIYAISEYLNNKKILDDSIEETINSANLTSKKERDAIFNKNMEIESKYGEFISQFPINNKELILKQVITNYAETNNLSKINKNEIVANESLEEVILKFSNNEKTKEVEKNDESEKVETPKLMEKEEIAESYPKFENSENKIDINNSINSYKEEIIIINKKIKINELLLDELENMKSIEEMLKECTSVIEKLKIELGVLEGGINNG